MIRQKLMNSNNDNSVFSGYNNSAMKLLFNKKIPHKSGIYIFKDIEGKPLYVGKAKDLKKRVDSYRRVNQLLPWTKVMINLAKDLEVVVTTNELEALLLENNFIKNFYPPFNIKMRDDKTYPYLKITKEEFPRLLITRKIESDGGRYFGPYLSAYMLKDTIGFLRRVFGLVTHKYRRGQRPCLDYELGLCAAPYAGKISAEEYGQNVAEAIKLLEGKSREVIKFIKQKMARAAQKMEFEKAARLRDELRSLERLQEQQHVVFIDRGNRDIIAVATHYSLAVVEIMLMREGNIIGNYPVEFENIEGKCTGEILENVIGQFYINYEHVPPEIFVNAPVNNQDLLIKALQYRGKKVKIILPKRGKSKRLIKLAEDNANFHLQQSKQKKNVLKSVLKDLQKILRLPKIPRRIEAFDISNLKSTNAVGAMVTFVDGEPYKNHYRKFIIKTVREQNDVAMMAEIVRRRFKNKSLPKPDLILIDGGRGQLGAILAVEKEENIDVPTIGLAKQWELVYTKDKSEPIILPENNQGLLLLKKIRDEVHRFGISFHRHRREKVYTI